MVKQPIFWCKKMRAPFVLLVVIWLAGILSGCISRFAMTRISVVDEETGKPVRGASVNCYYECINYSHWSGPEDNWYDYRETGGDNVLWIFGHGDAPSVGAHVDYPPDGYYCGRSDRKSFWKISYLCPIPIWLPPVRNLHVGVLKKLNQIPMYEGGIVDPARFDRGQRRREAKNFVEVYAYDCVVGDWCAPHGRGRTNDLIFTYSYKSFGSGTDKWGKPVAYYRMERKLTFSNPDDGVQPISRSGKFEGRPEDLIAPTEGYVPAHTSFCAETPDHGWRVSDDTHIDFYFRVRATRNADGTITGGHYGKISGRYCVYLGLQVKYILNPNPLDTNLEYNGEPLNPR